MTPDPCSPVRVVVRVARKHYWSTIVQGIVVWGGADPIDFVTTADWQDREVLLKAAFPVEVRCERATFEIQCQRAE